MRYRKSYRILKGNRAIFRVLGCLFFFTEKTVVKSHGLLEKLVILIYRYNDELRIDYLPGFILNLTNTHTLTKTVGQGRINSTL